MHLFTFVASTIALLATPILSAPVHSLVQVEKFRGQTRAGSFIVKLKSNFTKEDCLEWLTPQLGTASTLTHTGWEKDVLNGFAGEFSSDDLNLLRSSSMVESVLEDGIMSIKATTTQTNAPWGIARMSQNAKLASRDTTSLAFTYKFDDTAGSGVDVYVVDTGILTTHTQFEGRATWGKTFGGYPDADGNGHGTHVAGTVGSARFGVAKKASLIAVKVLSDEGDGAVSDIVSGLNFALTQSQASGRPSIVSMSLGGSVSRALDNAVAALTSAGVHVVVAAGNENADARTSSPARAPTAITVGASTINDAKASFSNFGASVDVWAPGQAIISLGITSNTALASLSGTSMATPHVSGLVATLISSGGNLSPAAMATKVKSLALSNPLSGVPSNTINNLARNDVA